MMEAMYTEVKTFHEGHKEKMRRIRDEARALIAVLNQGKRQREETPSTQGNSTSEASDSAEARSLHLRPCTNQ